MNDREERRVRADAQRQRQRDGQRERLGFPEQPQADTNVVQHESIGRGLTAAGSLAVA